jgi:hypothetical protein
MEDKRLPKIASKSSHNHHRLKQGWHKDARSWLNYWGIMEDTILQNKNTIKKNVKSKFKEKMWCDKECENVVCYFASIHWWFPSFLIVVVIKRILHGVSMISLVFSRITYGKALFLFEG